MKKKRKQQQLLVKFTRPGVYPEVNGKPFIGNIMGKKSDWIDLRVAIDLEILPGGSYLIPLGVAIQLPEGYEALVVPRSSTFRNFGIIQTNGIGVIDEVYKGDHDEWHFPAYLLKGRKPCNLKKGDRICQFRIIKHQPDLKIKVVESLGNTDRGGLGSTGIL